MEQSGTVSSGRVWRYQSFRRSFHFDPTSPRPAPTHAEVFHVSTSPTPRLFWSANRLLELVSTGVHPESLKPSAPDVQAGNVALSPFEDNQDSLNALLEQAGPAWPCLVVAQFFPKARNYSAPSRRTVAFQEIQPSAKHGLFNALVNSRHLPFNGMNRNEADGILLHPGQAHWKDALLKDTYLRIETRNVFR